MRELEADTVLARTCYAKLVSRQSASNKRETIERSVSAAWLLTHFDNGECVGPMHQREQCRTKPIEQDQTREATRQAR